MAMMQWDDSLSVGVDLIDEQHKSLIQRLNDMSEAVAQRQGEFETTRTLRFLIEYADFHFSCEEGHMEATGFPGLGQQQREHARFRTTLANLKQDYEEEGSTKGLAKALDTFLGTWLARHIQGIDRQFAGFLAEKGLVLGDEG